MFSLIFYIFIIIFFLKIFIIYVEKKTLFFPEKDITDTPESIGLKYEDIFISINDKEKIHAWFIYGKNAKDTVLYCHGNAGNISGRIDRIDLLANKVGVNILIFDYRGFGRSSNFSPTEASVYEDSYLAYKYLINERKINPDNLVLYGMSLGSAVAIDLMTRVKVKKAVIEGAFSSVSDMAKFLYPFIPRFLMPNKFASIEKIDKVKFPKLFIHSREDEVVPYHLGKKLFEKAQEPKQFLEITGTHFCGIVDNKDEYVKVVKDFITD